jgi:transposase-like protein
LRRENKRLEQENEILKRAAAFFQNGKACWLLISRA